MDSRLDKHLNKITKAINDFKEVSADVTERKKLIADMEKIRSDFGLAKSVFAKKLGLERQEYDAITKSKYSREYILKLLNKAKKLSK